MTSIEWTDETWNPTDGCSVCSAGCANCYAMRFAGRFSKPGERYHGLVTIGKNKRAIWTGEVRLDAGKLAKPLGWRKPRRVFVNSMSDLFHERLTNEQIAAVFGVMAAAPQHTFQILTKRAHRMREWFVWLGEHGDARALRRCGDAAQESGARVYDRIGPAYLDDGNVSQTRSAWNNSLCVWPLPNVWLGVSVENQAAADERIPELLATPAAVRFLSCEPLIGPVDISEYFDPCSVPCGEEPWPPLDWVIAGCESGPGARPCDIAWLRSLRDQCARAEVPYFLKQAKPAEGIDYGRGSSQKYDGGNRGGSRGLVIVTPRGGVITLPYLDGVQHAAFPAEPR